MIILVATITESIYLALETFSLKTFSNARCGTKYLPLDPASCRFKRNFGGFMTSQCLDTNALSTRKPWGLRMLVVFAISLLLGSLSLHAQLLTGSFSGTVLDP